MWFLFFGENISPRCSWRLTAISVAMTTGTTGRGCPGNTMATRTQEHTALRRHRGGARTSRRDLRLCGPPRTAGNGAPSVFVGLPSGLHAFASVESREVEAHRRSQSHRRTRRVGALAHLAEPVGCCDQCLKDGLAMVAAGVLGLLL